MEKDYPTAPDEGRETKDGPGRDDTNRTNSDPLARFAKDKRKRITRVEKNPGKFEGGESRPPRQERGYPGEGDQRPPRPYGNSGDRRSYNPNFTPDNKLRSPNGSFRKDTRSYIDTSKDDYFNSDRYNGDERNHRPSSGRDQRSGGRPQGSGYGQKPSYGSRSQGTDNRGGYNRDNRESRPGPRPAGPGSGRPGSYGDGRPGYGDNRREGGRFPADCSSGNRGPGAKKGGFDPRKSKPAFDRENYPKYPRGKPQEEIRLNRFLSMSGICSRREADDLIAAGAVTVNGQVVTEMGSKVAPEDVVRYNGSVVRGESKVYIVMNKPKGYVTSLDDPHAEKTVMDILKNSVKERIYPVGRLDKNSMGVLLITNDGDMTKKLTHPSHEKKKIYRVSLDRALSPEDMRKIAQGVTLEDGFIKADSIDYVKDDAQQIGIEIHSGRNRVVRRIFEHLGYQVHKLDRVYFAGLTKKNLKRGAWRFLTPREVSALHSGQYE